MKIDPTSGLVPLLFAALSLLPGCAAGTSGAERGRAPGIELGSAEDGGRVSMPYAEAETNYYYILSHMQDVPFWKRLPERPASNSIDATSEELDALLKFRQ